MTPQFVGQGMNSGIRDADNLSGRSRMSHSAAGRSALLDTYEASGGPRRESMIGISVFNKDIVSTAPDGDPRPRPRHRRHDARPGCAGCHRGEAQTAPPADAAPTSGMPRGPLGVGRTLAPQPVGHARGWLTRLDDATGSGWAAIGIGVMDPRAVDRSPSVGAGPADLDAALARRWAGCDR